MRSQIVTHMLCAFVAINCASAQQPNSCAGLMHFKSANVEITKAASIAAGTTEPNLWGPGHSAPLRAYCRMEGLVNRRTGVGGEEFGIRFVLSMPEKWKRINEIRGDMQELLQHTDYLRVCRQVL